jgi:hypothetical protein
MWCLKSQTSPFRSARLLESNWCSCSSRSRQD